MSFPELIDRQTIYSKKGKHSNLFDHKQLSNISRYLMFRWKIREMAAWHKKIISTKMALLDNSAAASAMYAGMSQYHLMNSRLMASESNHQHPQYHQNQQTGQPELNQQPSNAGLATAAAMAAMASRFSIDDISVGGVRSSPTSSNVQSANSSGADLSLNSSPKANERRSSSDSATTQAEIGMTMSLKVEPTTFNNRPYDQPDSSTTSLEPRSKVKKNSHVRFRHNEPYLMSKQFAKIPFNQLV